MSHRLTDALEFALRTDPGMVRSHNEDAVFVNPGQGFGLLADGMGGYNAGEVAASMATTLLSADLEQALAQSVPENVLENVRNQLLLSIDGVNHAIFQAAQNEPQYAGMGTTLVAAVFRDDHVTVAHIGDSRLYRLRQGVLETLTRDHSWLQEQLDSGVLTPEQARLSMNRNLVTRALGVDPQVDTEINVYPVQPGDIYLLCSDGLNDMVADAEIRTALAAEAGSLDDLAARLVQMANAGGGRDNVSVVLVRVREAFPLNRGAWARFRDWLK